MPRHPGLPRPDPLVLSKQEILESLAKIDSDPDSRARVLKMETDFRERIDTHFETLPAANAEFRKFNTSPFVLLFHSKRKGYGHVSELESDILPAKLFSSMETSAGRMIEEVVLPVYGWQIVKSEMHSSDSALDGKAVSGDQLRLATLKSGPRCLNDEMAENFADAVFNHAGTWAEEARLSQIDFTYGVLYGTYKQSNKKDWHILRNLREKAELAGHSVLVSPDHGWTATVELGDVEVTATIRIGCDWWEYLGGAACAVEVWTSLIRACIEPRGPSLDRSALEIVDLAEILSLEGIPEDFNPSLLQRTQIPWLFLIASHFSDSLM